jgi:hypothetical protein
VEPVLVLLQLGSRVGTLEQDGAEMTNVDDYFATFDNPLDFAREALHNLIGIAAPFMTDDTQQLAEAMAIKALWALQEENLWDLMSENAPIAEEPEEDAQDWTIIRKGGDGPLPF